MRAASGPCGAIEWRMAKLLLNLRHVSDDEADDVRAFLKTGGIAIYETQPSRWGISHGGIWVEDNAQVAEAKRLMADYQKQRQAPVRAERAQAVRAGTAATSADIARQQPPSARPTPGPTVFRPDPGTP